MSRNSMYILEGNIGAGKSTFLRLVKQQLSDISIALEPMDNWQKQVYGQSLLTNFYQKPKRWAYTLETLTMMSRIMGHLAEQKHANATRIMERSIYSGYYCFAHNSYAQGFMTGLEWHMYQEWFNVLVKKCKNPRGFIYLRVTPEVAYERIRKRNRHAEKTLSLAYLKQIHHQHELFLLKKQHTISPLKDIPILVLDCNKEFETNMQEMHQHIHALQNFLMQTGSTIPPYKHQCTHQQQS